MSGLKTFLTLNPTCWLVCNECKFICFERHLIWDLDSLPGQLARLVDLVRWTRLSLSHSLVIMYIVEAHSTLGQPPVLGGPSHRLAEHNTELLALNGCLYRNSFYLL